MLARETSVDEQNISDIAVENVNAGNAFVMGNLDVEYTVNIATSTTIIDNAEPHHDEGLENLYGENTSVKYIDNVNAESNPDMGRGNLNGEGTSDKDTEHVNAGHNLVIDRGNLDGEDTSRKDIDKVNADVRS